MGRIEGMGLGQIMETRDKPTGGADFSDNQTEEDDVVQRQSLLEHIMLRDGHISQGLLYSWAHIDIVRQLLNEINQTADDLKRGETPVGGLDFTVVFTNAKDDERAILDVVKHQKFDDPYNPPKKILAIFPDDRSAANFQAMNSQFINTYVSCVVASKPQEYIELISGIRFRSIFSDLTLAKMNPSERQQYFDAIQASLGDGGRAWFRELKDAREIADEITWKLLFGLVADFFLKANQADLCFGSSLAEFLNSQPDVKNVQDKSSKFDNYPVVVPRASDYRLGQLGIFSQMVSQLAERIVAVNAGQYLDISSDKDLVTLFEGVTLVPITKANILTLLSECQERLSDPERHIEATSAEIVTLRYQKDPQKPILATNDPIGRIKQNAREAVINYRGTSSQLTREALQERHRKRIEEAREAKEKRDKNASGGNADHQPENE
jgi:hypothetical protein